MQTNHATADTAPQIVAIWNNVIENTARTFTTDLKTVSGLIQDIQTRQKQGHAFLIACDQDRVLGFACYSQFRNGPGYRHTMEHTIIIDDTAHGRGVGRALMDALCNHARDQGVHSMFAGVSGENPDGVAFHAKIGFQTIATLPQVGHKFGRWMDLVLMQKILNPSQ